MANHHAGGCACGRLRYVKSGDPVAELFCQCLQCQKRSGTGHAAFLVFSGRDDFVVSGAVTTWSCRGDSGQEKQHAFCPECGTSIYVSFPASPDMLAIHPGSLDDPTIFNPRFVTYAQRAQPWDSLDQSLVRFETMPPK